MNTTATRIPSDLLREAQNAVPPIGQSGKWAPVLPAVEILLARRFSLTDAIEWLVAKNAISPGDRKSAYYSISQRLRRAGIPAPRKNLALATTPATIRTRRPRAAA